MSGITDSFNGNAKQEDIAKLLQDKLGAIVSTDAQVLKSHQHDWWSLSAIHDFQGKQNPLPVAVVMPETTEQVSQTLKICHDAGIRVVPFGGGSGVCGAIKAEEGVVMISMEKMTGLIDIDKQNMTATYWAGTNGMEAEKLAEKDGLTIGHWPQSIEISTVGGWIATKAAGQFSTANGNIEDMVLNLEAVLPDGTIINTKQVPRASAGFDLRQLFLGTEGMHGIVTKVSFSLREMPESSKGQAFAFDTMEDGLDAMREFVNAGWKPPVVRLYDTQETQRQFPGKCLPGKKLLVLIHEGPKDLVDVQMKNVKTICEKHKGWEKNSKIAAHWLEKRNKVPSFKDLLEKGIVADTIEISATWDKIPGLYKKVMAAVNAVPGVALVGAHSSHSYRSGTNLYITFAAKPEDESKMEETYKACWEKTMQAVIEAGGSISHHHGIGRVRKDFLKDEIGEEGIELLRKIKEAIDPKGILNPGLLPPRSANAKKTDNQPKIGK